MKKIKQIGIILIFVLLVFIIIKIYVERNSYYLIGKIIDINEYNGVTIEYITGLKSNYKRGGKMSFLVNNSKKFEKGMFVKVVLSNKSYIAETAPALSIINIKCMKKISDEDLKKELEKNNMLNEIENTI